MLFRSSLACFLPMLSVLPETCHPLFPYQLVMPFLVPLGSCSIESVKLSDAKEWALRMKEKGYSFKTISNDKRSLKAAFYTAIQDDCIRKNPFDFKLNTVLKDNTEPKVPLTPAQEESFLSFAQGDKVYQKYYDELIILLGTGLRISELCGLTDTDIDFRSEERRVGKECRL